MEGLILSDFPIIGFKITGQDNGMRILSVPSQQACSECGLISEDLRMNLIYSNIAQERCVHDISVTYDGFYITSGRFERWVLDLYPAGVKFLKLGGDSNLCVFDVSRKIPFDVNMRRTKMLNQCPKCGEYDEVVGATPAFVKTDKLLGDGFFRTDIRFGSRNNKQYAIILSPTCYTQCRAMKFTGAVFYPVYGRPKDVRS